VKKEGKMIRKNRKNIERLLLKILSTIYTIILIFPSFNYAQMQGIRFRHLTIDDGLSHSYVSCIFQDDQGFMWFGTFDGLNKYDGYNFTIYRHDYKDSNSIASNIIRSMYKDSQGNLWIGTAEGLCLYDRNQDAFINYNEKNGYNLGSFDIWSIFKDSQNNLWIGTLENGLFLFDPQNNVHIEYSHKEDDPTSLSNNNVRKIFEDSKGNLWIATLGGGLNLFNRDTKTFTHIKHQGNDPNSIIGDQLLTMVEDNKGYLWFGCYKDGLSCIHLDELDQRSFINYQHNPQNSQGLCNNLILSLFVSKNGGIWIGTENGGLDYLQNDKKTFIHYENDQSDPNSLNNNSIYSIYQDEIGNLWIGTYAGGVNLYTHTKQAFKHFKNLPGNPNSLSYNSVWDFDEDRKGNIWIATDGGGLNKFDPHTGNFEYYNSKNSNLNKDAVLTVFVDSKNNVWIGTWDGGISLFNKQTKSFTTFKSENTSLSSNDVFDIVEDRNGDLWFATQGGFNKFNKKDRSFIAYTEDNSNLIYNKTEVIKEDYKGNILIGTHQGFVVFNPETEEFVNYTHDPENENSLSNNFVTSIFEEDNTTLWITTTNGLNKLNRITGIITRYFKKDGLPNNLIFGIEKDKNGFLWISTNGGISRFNQKTGEFKNFTKEDGLQGNTFIKKSHYRARDGKIYFGGVNGFNVFDPDDVIENKAIPPIVVTDFQIFNKSVKINEDDSPLKEHINIIKELLLSYKQSVFSFEFVALNYISSSENQYAYMLKGFDKEWNYVGNKREATYTNIDPGKYIFQVKGSNNDGVWNEEGASIKIVITPPFWRTLWFRIIVIISIIAIIYIIFKIRVRNIEAHRRELVLKVKERTQQLSKKATELNKSKIKLEYERYLLDSIINSIPDLIYVKDRKSRLTKINIAYVKRLGVQTPEELIGKTDFDFFSREHAQQAYDDEQKIMNTGNALLDYIEKETWENAPDTWASSSKMPFKDINGKIIGIIGISKNVTKIKEAEIALNESKKNLEQAKKETDNILHNVNEGFFLLDKEYKISSQYSSALEIIFSRKKLAHLNLLEFFSDKIPDNEINNTRRYLDLLFKDTINGHLIQDLNPLNDIEFTFDDKGSEVIKYLNFDFKKIKSKRSKTKELVVTVRDVTQQVLLSEQLKKEEARREKLLQLMLSILDVEPQMLTDFSESTNRELEFIDEIMNRSEISDYNDLLIKVHRAVHLIKGNAKLLNIEYFAEQAHKFEDVIAEIQSRPKISNQEIEPLRKRLKEMQTGMEEMERIIEKMGQVLTHKDRRKKTDAKLLLQSLQNLISSFSSDLGKKIKFDYKNFRSNIIPDRYHLLVKEVLIQLVRNSISHGIETPEERKRLKKPIYGKIEISTFKKNGTVGFRLRDDGRGLQIEKLKERAVQSGKWKTEDIGRWGEKQIADLIFTSGITTSERADMISGRGVGMDGVKHRLKEHNGDIRIHFDREKYCEFEIILPSAV